MRNGRLLYPFQVDPPSGMTQVPVQIAADGSVQGGTRYGVFEPMMRRDYRTELMTVAGRVAGNTLDITESDHRCTRRSLLQRR